MEKLTKALMTDETGQAIVTKLNALSGQMHELAMATRGNAILFESESDISVLGDGGYLAVYVGTTNPLVISGWTGDNSLVTGHLYYLIKSGTAVASSDLGEYGGAATDTTLSVSGAPADAKAVGEALADFTIEVDDTLSEQGKAADAKATGDKFANVNGRLGDVKKDLTYIEKKAENTGSLTWSEWEQGSLSSSAGAEVSSAYNVRSTGYLPKYATSVTVDDTDFVVVLYGYTSDGTYVRSSGAATTLSVSSFMNLDSSLAYCRLRAYRSDNAQITPATACTITIAYSAYAFDSDLDDAVAGISANTANITANTTRIAKLFATTTTQPYVKEIYLTGVNGQGIEIRRIAHGYYQTANSTYVTIINLYDPDSAMIVARYMEEISTAKTHGADELVPIVERNSSGISGYAVIDWSKVTFGDDIRTVYALNMDKVTTLEYNPIICDYLRDTKSREMDRGIRKTYQYKSADFSIDGYIDYTNESIVDTITGYKRTAGQWLLKGDVIRAKLYSSSTKAGLCIWTDESCSSVIYKSNNNRTTSYILYTMPSDGYVVFSSTQLDDVDVQIYRSGYYPDIVYHNFDKESLLSQAILSRSNHFSDTYITLNFLHFSDIHRGTWNWDRLCEYIDYYSDKMFFAIHTGDYVGAHAQSYDNHYTRKQPSTIPILNCVGNHDTYGGSGQGALTAGKSTTYDILFGDADVPSWGCTFGSNEYDMYYYKDVADTGIRLVVIDQYYWDNNEATWLTNVLEDARTNDLYVITATHASTGTLTTIGSTFFSAENWTTDVPDSDGHNTEIETIINAFTSAGGVHICNLCGHWHHDKIGTTSSGILTVVVETASGVIPTSSDTTTEYDDSARIPFEKCWDSANYMSIDRNLGIMKVVRVGCNANARLQGRNVLAYDFINDQIISNY